MKGFVGKGMSSTEINIEGEWLHFSAALSAPQTPQCLDYWPCGKRWFLPHYQGKVTMSAAPEMYDDGTATLSAVVSDIQNLTDPRIQARLLRWGYIELWLPVLRAWRRLTRKQED